jgi:predicted ATPase
VDEGLRAADDALATVQMTDERFVEAELHRLRGELLMRASPPDPAAALSALEMALDVARRQGARAFEIRAQTSLSQLRRDFAGVPVDLIGEPYLAATRPAARPWSARS